MVKLSLPLVIVTLGVQLSPEQDLAMRLNARDVRVRMIALTQLTGNIDANPHLLADPSIQTGIITLLELENGVVGQNLSRVRAGEPSQLGEGYGEHYSAALGLANRLRKADVSLDAPLQNRLRRALVTGTYNPDSEFVKDLARDGNALVSTVLEMTKASDGPTRWNAYALISELLQKQEARLLNEPLSPASVTALRAAAREGLQDPAADVRIWAIAAVVSARDREALPLLIHLAQTDPDTDKGRMKYSVRSAAAAAATALR